MDIRERKILDFLETKGLETKADIAPLINSLFPVPKEAPEWEYTKVLNGVRRFLEALNTIDPPYQPKTGTIRFDFALLNALPHFRDSPSVWLHSLPASITKEGIEALKKERDRENQEEVNQSAIDVNNSIKATNEAVVQVNSLMLQHAENQETLVNRQNRLYEITLVLTAINILLGGGILYATLTSNYDKQEIETLRTQIINQNKELKQLQLLKSDTVRYVIHYPLPKSKSGKK